MHQFRLAGVLIVTVGLWLAPRNSRAPGLEGP